MPRPVVIVPYDPYWPRMASTSILREGSPHHTKHILFRDWLRTHLADADAYRELKIRLSEKYKDNRVDYTESKTAFINEIVKKAK